MAQALIFYHFFYPDDVVSSRHFSDLAEGLVERGWDVVAKPSNRGCRDESRTYQASEVARNIEIRRIWRPRWPQSRTIGRFLNALWMHVAWSFSAVQGEPPHVLIIGTDPIASVLVAIPWKILRPRTKIVHWCFDLYPEAAIADGTLRRKGIFARALRLLLRRAYACCDVLVDIGPCMREQLSTYRSSARTLTITPWALAEPSSKVRTDLSEREAIFGSAALGLMYSGNFGRAHSHREILQLAQTLRKQRVRFAFSVRGNRTDELQSAISEQHANARLIPFADESQLEARLSAADIHIVSLREEWTGTVVPSKFFGALAVGRPVLFVGSPRSSVAIWIRKHGVGWVLHEDNLVEVASELTKLATEPQILQNIFIHCHSVYQQHFSRKKVIDRLADELCAISGAWEADARFAGIPVSKTPESVVSGDVIAVAEQITSVRAQQAAKSL